LPPIFKTDSKTPFPNSLQVGTYDVRLTTKSIYIVPWRSEPVEITSEAPAVTQIKVEKTAEPYADATISSPYEIKLDENQSNVTFDVTLSSMAYNLELNDVESVKLKIDNINGLGVREQTFLPSLSKTFTSTFTFPYEGKPDVKTFKGEAIYILKGGGYITSPFVFDTTTIYKLDNNIAPFALLNMPETTTISNVYINAFSSYDIDGDIVNYDFYIPRLGFSQSGDKASCFPYFGAVGTYQVVLGVTDDDGARSETSSYINVTPPSPSVEISSPNYFKQNRKITFSAINWTESLSPVGDNYEWTIKPMDTNIPQSSVKMLITHGKQIETLMKSYGKYLVTCTGTNSYGISDTKTKIIRVEEDVPPEINLYSNTPKFRDDTRVATIKVRDETCSRDGDFIAVRYWYYHFDSDNDGSFTDEPWIYAKGTSDPSDHTFEFEASSVGKYEIMLSVKEGFGQETIPQFITDSDYRVASKSIVVTVDNYAPKVNFYAVNEKKIDLKIVTDYEGVDLLNLESKLNTLVSDGYEQFLNINYEVISEKKYLGRYIPEGATGYSLVEDQSTEKYKVATWAGGLTEFSDHTYTVSYSTKYVLPRR